MSKPDSTELVTAMVDGDPRAADELFPIVYDSLHGMAERALRREKPSATLQATMLVHEVYLRLVDQTRVDWRGACHFKAVAARAMYRVIVDHVRARKRQKRGGNWRRVELHDALHIGNDKFLDILMLEEVMEKLREFDERQFDVARLRLLADMTTEQAAQALGISTRTLEREWRFAKAWLRRELGNGSPEDG